MHHGPLTFTKVELHYFGRMIRAITDGKSMKLGKPFKIVIPPFDFGARLFPPKKLLYRPAILIG